MRIVGHLSDVGPQKRKPYVVALGLHFERALLRESLRELAQRATHPACAPAWLDEIRVEHLHFPMFFICRYCGRLHTCECFRPYIDADEHRRYLSGRPELLARVNDLQFFPGLCHLCRRGVPAHQYGSPMYYSSFGQRYLPYIELCERRSGDRSENARRAAENEARALFGFPAIGERWTSETILFRVVEMLFAPREVVHHYRGKELQGLELDVWIPELKLGIEYQGEQHYEVVEHWGGQEGLAKRQLNDRRKRALCKQLQYNLVEFKFSEPLTEDSVRRKLKRFLTAAPEA